MKKYILSIIVFTAALFAGLPVFAEGSKDLYPDGASGGRAYLRASNEASLAFPFPNLGTHFVYAEEGERIALASNAQSGTNKRIYLYNPSGEDVTPAISSGNGNISDRTAELAGPRLPNQTSGNQQNRYTPIYYTVPEGGSGIYKVEFRGTNNNTTGDTRLPYSAATSWPSGNNTYNYLIAWDISVAKQTGSNWAWVPGRVYTNVLNMDNPSYKSNPNTEFRDNSGFYGKFKVLTRDGYVYNVNNNGMQGISFTFMVNNRGFHIEKPSGTASDYTAHKNVPSYKSIKAPDANTVQNRYHDPRSADAEAAVTHKIFYNIPDPDMPKSATGGPEANKTTWLRPKQQNLNVTDMQVEGVDATVAQISNKGGYIIFENNSGDDYTITISPSIDDPNYQATMHFETRILTGQSYPGVNRIYFDGKDGYGEYLPQGNIPVEVSIQLQGAEVHFPYIDMELNKNGIIIELLKKEDNYQTVLSDKVYWDDSGIGDGGGNNGSKSNPINASHTQIPNGTSSNTNGHIWGTNSNATAGTFGDNQGMDTWTFIKGDSYTQSFAVVHKVADLSIESVTVASENEKIKIGDELTYTVVAANKKGSCPVEGAPFSFILPEGFVPVDSEGNITVEFSSSCGLESEEIKYDATTNSYKSKLKLGGSCDATGGDCKVTYTFKVKVTKDANPANTEVIATIMRPNDVTDPDATNTSDPLKPKYTGSDFDKMDNNFYYPPTDPFFEVKHNGKDGESNNIKDLDITLIRESDLAITKTSDPEENAEIGKEVTFKLTVSNNGPHDAIDVLVTDEVPNGYSNINSISDGGTITDGVITWTIAALAKDATKEVSFNATVNNTGEYENVAKVTSTDPDSEDPDLSNNEDSHNPVKSNTTHAVDDFFETGNNTPITGNVLENDYDNEGHNQKVTTTGTIRTTEGGTVTIDEDGDFTYTPPADKNGIFDTFTYTVCDNGSPQACDEAEVVIAVGICYEAKDGEPFKWRHASGSGTITETITQPTTTYGFVFDIYELDNSFNMEVNGTKLAINEIEFQSSGTSGINIMFKDGDKYETNTSDIWQMQGTTEKPLIRVMIGPTGKVSMYGSKTSEGDLYPLVLFNGNKFNNVSWSSGNGDNTITVTQNVVGVTEMDGVGYGANRVDCPNYWYGFEDSEWDENAWYENSNWTDNYVPATKEDIEFATKDNNSGSIMGLSGPGAGKGEAINDLHLDKDREIKDLINNSSKDLIITQGNELIIHGVVKPKEVNAGDGTIIVKAGENGDNAVSTGSLIFKDPDANSNVQATVEFYNKAYECADCGYFRKSWQYFGIPVSESGFPYLDPQVETINEWMENVNGNKWVNRDENYMLQAFRGYEITNSSKFKPENIYQFKGKLNVGDASVELSKTSGVNYEGMNLVANSFTAAIPISDDAIQYNNWEKTVYLFNTGTRDQWRKLNGGTVTHDTQSGQYKSVPLHVAGNAGLPSSIPSMHTFMIEATESTTSANEMTLVYDKLVKNELVDGMAWRSAKAEKREIPHIVVDVIGSNSADRVWLFEQAGTTRGFDAGWDGVKMPEKDIVQIFVAGETKDENYQVATVPQMVGTSFGLKPELNDNYTLNIAVSPDVEIRGLYLRDMLTGRSYALKNGAEYRVSGSTSSDNRFKVVDNTLDESKLGDNPLIDIYVQDNQVVVANNSEEDCIVSLFDISGRLVAKRAVASNGTTYVSTAISGVYVVKVIGGTVNESKRVVVK